MTKETVYDEKGIRKTAEPYKPPQLFYGEDPAPVFVTPAESVHVHLLAENPQAQYEERDWIYRAYQIAMATWTNEELDGRDDEVEDTGHVPREEMVRVLKHEMARGAALVPMEAFTLTFTIEGIPRAVTHQIVRARKMGFGQESFRVSDIRKHRFRLPLSLVGDSEEKEHLRKVYEDAVTHAYNAYAFLVDHGVPHEDARNVMGMGTITYIVCTMNLRTFIDYLFGRTQDAVLDEHRLVPEQMFAQFKEMYPLMYDILKPKFPANLTGVIED